MRGRAAGVVAVLVAVLVALLVDAVGGPAAATGHGSAPRAAPRAVPLPEMGTDGHWWFTAWQIPKVWAAGARGQGVTVAVLDTGVQASRPELGRVVLPGTNSHGGDGRTDHSRQVDGDDGGHGTGMALFIAGQGGSSGLVGVAPEAKILPVVRQNGSDDVARNIRWAVDHGAKVLNLSYGVLGPCSEEAQAAVRYAIDHGVVVVAAAGNDGEHRQEPFGSPANCRGSLTVGAFDNQLRIWNRSNQSPFVGVAAPGVHMQSITLAGQRSHSNGTSASSALTSGVIALVWSKYPQLTNRQVVARVLATARDLGAPGRDDAFGYGGVRPYQAVTMKVPLDAPNPIFDRLPVATATPSPSAPAETASTQPGSGGSGVAGFGLPVLLVVGGIGLVVVVLVVAVVVVLIGRSSRRRARQTAARYPGYPGPPAGS